MLKVGGSGHFDGELNTKQLFVQEYITYLKSLKGPRMDVDTIKMDNTRGIFGNTKIFGDVQIKQNLVVDGTAIINGGLTTNQISLGTVANPFTLASMITSNGAIVNTYGNVSLYTLPPLPPTTCLVPVITGDNWMSQRLTIINQSTFPTNTNLLDFRNDGINGFIDYGFNNYVFVKSGFDANGDPVPSPSPPAPVLKINSSCHGDVEIAKGGGITSVGSWLEVGYPIRNTRIASNIKGTGTGIGQRVTVASPFLDNSTTTPIVYNSQLFVNKNRIHALSVFNTTTNTAGDEKFVIFGDGKTQINATVKANKYFTVVDNSNTTTPVESFIVYGDGKTVIGAQKLNIGPHIDALLTVDGKIVAKSCYVTQLNWADYVFDKDYKLPNLYDIEKYYLANKHLSEMPTEKEVQKNGIDLGEMNKLLLKKIEEMTMMMVKQQKDIDILKSKLK